MLLSVNDIRQLNKRTPEMSYMIIEKCIEKFFTDLLRYHGVLNQNYILIDSTYLPYQYLSIEVIEKVIYLLEKELGFSVVVQKMDNDTYNGFSKGDLIQILLFDPLDFDESEANVQLNSTHHQTLYSTFNGYNNLRGEIKGNKYLDTTGYKSNLLSEAVNNVLKLPTDKINEVFNRKEIFETDIDITSNMVFNS